MAFSADPLLRHGNTHGRVVATVDRLDLHDVDADADGTFAIDLMAWRGVAGLYLLVPETACVLMHGITSAWALQEVKWSRFCEF
ncbi:hypothetical protein P43SY_010586 [Pythium insidiosum]|uniref:Uncharacterized protein n=1 Tax=Pythium insidiosum TaxID=114742 RepID=A0AAD5L7V7_PYTIN|nr:hypothetical protein P43SY_010586 [Pythium insidiosum]